MILKLFDKLKSHVNQPDLGTIDLTSGCTVKRRVPKVLFELVAERATPLNSPWYLRAVETGKVHC